MKNCFTEEQIIKGLKEHEGGRPVTDIVCALGIAEQTLYTNGSTNTATRMFQ